MKVYVLFGHYGAGEGTNFGVFTSLEKAKEELINLRGISLSFEVHEWNLDQIDLEGSPTVVHVVNVRHATAGIRKAILGIDGIAGLALEDVKKGDMVTVVTQGLFSID